MISICGHSFLEDRLPEAPNVLDVGCRDFAFSREILQRWSSAQVRAIDPDRNIIRTPADLWPRCKWRKAALVGDARREAEYVSFSTGEANYLLPEGEEPPANSTVYTVDCERLDSFPGPWHLVKLDCEGSEIGILENWPARFADQITVEFHDGLYPGRWDDAYFERLFAGPLKDYDVVKHELTPMGPGAIMGHWDSLFVLKEKL